MIKKIALKDALVAKGYDIKIAEAIIRIGNVQVNNETIFLPNQMINSDSLIKIKETKKWVSRGALKLLKAIKIFNLNFENKNILDIGSSTGGFTQVALEKGAKKVWSLDVGTNQLDYSLRSNNQVVVLEKTHFNKISKELISEKIDIVVCDVSFISVKKLFLVLENFLETKTQLMILIKPQFEATSKFVQEGGYVEKQHHQYLIDIIIENANKYGFEFKHIAESPITGSKSKNIEYISLFERK